jgi:C-terminal processing protease CtpA/Prc
MERIMSKQKVAIALLAIALMGSDAAFAQRVEQAQAEQARARAAAERALVWGAEDQAQRTGASQAEISRARAEMEQARLQMEKAARVIATQAQFAPNLEKLNENLHYEFASPFFGSRARIGVNVVDSELGALVTQVMPGSGADSAGLKVGDVIQSVNGGSVATADQGPAQELMAQLRDVEPGDSVSLVVERAGQTLNFDVDTSGDGVWVSAIPGANGYAVQFDGNGNGNGNGNGPNVVSLATTNPGDRIFRSWAFASSPWGDMELVAMSESLGRYFDTEEGMLVVHAPEDDAIDVQDGDVILSIGGRTPNSPEHAIRILSSFETGETIELSIMRDGRKRSVEYTVPEQNNPRVLFAPGAPDNAPRRVPNTLPLPVPTPN